ncbi:MAG: sugar phosphate isomerase/epimerase [Sphaerochaetaceae bacterium]|nr:sugar phosphate isomerase/epimerase [Sphaerochaetaceae bacterium]
MLTSSSSGALIRRVGYEKAFQLFKEVGLEAMDFPVDNGVYSLEALNSANVLGLSEKEIVEKFTAIRHIAERYGIRIAQTHSVFGSYEFSITQKFHDICEGDLIATAALGCDVTVFHPIRLPGRIRKEKAKEGFEANLIFFRSLEPLCRRLGVRIAIENIMGIDSDKSLCASQCSDPNELVQLVQELGTDCFCTCCDTGHFALTEKDTGYTVGDCIRILGDTLKVIHVQEVDRINDIHTVPYTYSNVMDWDDIYRALQEIGYKGTMNLEVMPHLSKYPDCPEMNYEAMRHISAIAHYAASKVDGKNGEKQ